MADKAETITLELSEEEEQLLRQALTCLIHTADEVRTTVFQSGLPADLRTPFTAFKEKGYRLHEKLFSAHVKREAEKED